MTLTDHRQASESAQPITEPPAGSNLPPTTSHTMPRQISSAGSTSPAPMPASKPKRDTAQGGQTSRDHVRHGVQGSVVSTSNVPPDQRAGDDQRRFVGGDQTSSDHPSHEPQLDIVAAPTSTSPANRRPDNHVCRAGLVDPLLSMCADVLDDMERTRIANENRLRQMTRTEADEDGQVRGFGMDGGNPQVASIAGIVDGLKRLEHQAELELKRSLRKHPLGPWIKQTVGVGEKQGARLLAALGDPYWNDLHERPRTVSELWAYCGYHVLPASQVVHGIHTKVAGGSKDGGDIDQVRCDNHQNVVGVAASRARGQKANWSADAKMRAYLIAESCVKQSASPYRKVYDAGREKYRDAVHQADCKRCGPAGKPALVGSPLSLGHQHARAMRLISKELLKDFWLQAKAIHENGRAS